jgi:hypothetical protein
MRFAKRITPAPWDVEAPRSRISLANSSRCGIGSCYDPEMRSGNPDPYPPGRFAKGVSGNPWGRRKGTLDRATVLQRAPRNRSQAEIKADLDSWKGSAGHLQQPRVLLLDARHDANIGDTLR